MQGGNLEREQLFQLITFHANFSIYRVWLKTSVSQWDSVHRLVLVLDQIPTSPLPGREGAVSSSSCDHRKVPYGIKSCGQGCVAEGKHTKRGKFSVLLLTVELCPAPARSAQLAPPEGKFSIREQKQQRWEKWPVTILEKAGSMSGCVAGTSGSSSPWLWFINTTLIFVHIQYLCGKYIKNVFNKVLAYLAQTMLQENHKLFKIHTAN